MPRFPEGRPHAARPGPPRSPAPRRGDPGSGAAADAAPGRSLPQGTAGFTLLEVLVALTIGAILLVGARTMLQQIGDGAAAITAAAEESDREANADLLLRTLVGRLEMPVEGAGIKFQGTPRGVRFVTWCDVPAGWLERCQASLGIVQAGGAQVLALTPGSGDVVPLRRGFTRGEILYLREAAGGGAWVRSWSSEVAAPLALAIVLDGDTSIIRIGERG
jgi:prepilin-type N-terminal cleavage/methylation domain-containing protein